MAYEWVTLREAHARTGLSIATMRSWYRKGTIASKETVTEYGPTRLVRLDQIEARTDRKRTPPTSGTVELPAVSVANALDALSAAVKAMADQQTRLAESERARQTAERVVEQLAGSRYAAQTLTDTPHP